MAILGKTNRHNKKSNMTKDEPGNIFQTKREPLYHTIPREGGLGVDNQPSMYHRRSLFQNWRNLCTTGEDYSKTGEICTTGEAYFKTGEIYVPPEKPIQKLEKPMCHRSLFFNWRNCNGEVWRNKPLCMGGGQLYNGGV